MAQRGPDDMGKGRCAISYLLEVFEGFDLGVKGCLFGCHGGMCVCWSTSE